MNCLYIFQIYLWEQEEIEQIEGKQIQGTELISGVWSNIKIPLDVLVPNSQDLETTFDVCFTSENVRYILLVLKPYGYLNFDKIQCDIATLVELNAILMAITIVS